MEPRGGGGLGGKERAEFIEEVLRGNDTAPDRSRRSLMRRQTTITGSASSFSSSSLFLRFSVALYDPQTGEVIGPTLVPAPITARFGIAKEPDGVNLVQKNV